MDFVNFLPGVSTPAGNRDATINGLPRGMINITLDGVNIQDNTLRIDRRLLRHRQPAPRLGRGGHRDDGDAGRRRRRAGRRAGEVRDALRHQHFTGSGYYYNRNDKLNANTWFNNRNGVAKAKLKQNQIGGRAGGPIVIPGLFDGHNKAFFFGNFEQLRQPSDTTRKRTMLNPAAPPATSPTARRRSTCWSSRRATASSRRWIRPSASSSPTSRPRRPADRSSDRPEPRSLLVQRAGRVEAPLPDFRLDYNLSHATIARRSPTTTRSSPTSRTRSTTATPVIPGSRSKPARSRCV